MIICMSFTTEKIGGSYTHKLKKEEQYLYHDVGTGANIGAWVGFAWNNPNIDANIIRPTWSPSSFSLVQPYTVVYFWIRTK